MAVAMFALLGIVFAVTSLMYPVSNEHFPGPGKLVMMGQRLLLTGSHHNAGVVDKLQI